MKTSTEQFQTERKSAVPAAESIQWHLQMLGHRGCGVTELRIFEPKPLVAYADHENHVLRLAMEMQTRTSGIYVGVQPRPAELFDLAPNCWRPARGGRQSNCGTDKHIEYITACFWDIDSISACKGPASDGELQHTLQAAGLLCRQDGLAMSSTICCSGNGHYVLAPIVPVDVDNSAVAPQFKKFCQQCVESIATRVSKARIDPVYNLSRVMRLMGTMNRKGQPMPDRPHRRAHFVSEPVYERSMAIHYKIINMDVQQSGKAVNTLSRGIKCNLAKLEKCEFIQWCRRYPSFVSQSQWFALITNLAHLRGGPELIHQVSRLDKHRYSYRDTERIINRVIKAGYNPVLCKTIESETMTSPGRRKFECSKISNCQARAPIYLATLNTVYK